VKIIHPLNKRAQFLIRKYNISKKYVACYFIHSRWVLFNELSYAGLRL